MRPGGGRIGMGGGAGGGGVAGRVANLACLYITETCAKLSLTASRISLTIIPREDPRPAGQDKRQGE
jgi:hypothetical protein